MLTTYDRSRRRNVTSAGLALVVSAVFGLVGASVADAAGADVTGCPTKPSGVTPSNSAAAHSELVPPGALSVTVCRYRGLNDPAPRYVGALAGSAVLTDAARVQALSARFNALPPAVGGPVACPADDGSMALALFRYRDAGPDPVSIRLAGCSIASNGYVVGDLSFDAGARLRADLVRLTGCHAFMCMSDPIVPRVVGLDLATAYQRLHRAGLRVSFPAVELDYDSGRPVAYVVGQSVRGGRALASGGIVRLRLGCPGCGVGSPGVPPVMPVYRVPRFAGRSVDYARRWVTGKTLDFTVHVGPLVGGNAQDLLGNYRVTRQRPRAGARLSLGIGRRCCGGTGGSFLPTPLVVWGVQAGRSG